MALKDRGSAFEGFAALYDGTGNSDATIVETVATKCVLDYELVQLVHNHGGKPFKSVPLGKLPELWPFDLLKRPLLEHAEEFVRQIGVQGFQSLTNVHQFLVSGPFSEKVGEMRSWTPEAGNHLIPHPRTAERVWGYRGDEFDWHKGCAFLITGQFTRHARHGHIDEQTGMVYL